jgi:transcriptional regulator with XRE-family HTH domain
MIVMTRQIKAARSLIGWDQYALATNAGIAISTVRRLEGLDGPIAAYYETIEKIRTAFERAGIEFLGNPYPGVRIILKGVSGLQKGQTNGEDGQAEQGDPATARRRSPHPNDAERRFNIESPLIARRRAGG